MPLDTLRKLSRARSTPMVTRPVQEPLAIPVPATEEPGAPVDTLQRLHSAEGARHG